MEKDNWSKLQDIMEHYTQNMSYIQYNPNTSDALRLNISSRELYQTYIASKDEILIATLYFICRLIESGLAIVGNLITIVVCARVKRMQTNTNLLITSLAIGDLLSGLDTPFYMVAEMNQDSRSGYLYCMIAQYVDLLGGFGNTFSITCLALDRMVAVQYPVQYMQCLLRKQLLMALAVMWFYIASFLAFLFAFGQVEDFKYPICFFKSNMTSWAHDGVIYGHVSVLSLLTVIFYVKVWRGLAQRNTFAVRHGGLGGQSVAAKRRLHRRVMRMLGLIMGMYFALALPITVGSFCGLLSEDMSTFQHATFRVCWAIWYMNSFVNPLLYVWSNSSFREALCHQSECVIGQKMGCINRRQEDRPGPGGVPESQYQEFMRVDSPSTKVTHYTPSRQNSTVV